MQKKDSYLLIEAPTNGTVYLGHIVFRGTETETKGKFRELNEEMDKKVKQRQSDADKISGPYGIAATEISPSEFVIVNENEWEQELEYRRNR